MSGGKQSQVAEPRLKHEFILLLFPWLSVITALSFYNIGTVLWGALSKCKMMGEMENDLAKVAEQPSHYQKFRSHS